MIPSFFKFSITGVHCSLFSPTTPSLIVVFTSFEEVFSFVAPEHPANANTVTLTTNKLTNFFNFLSSIPPLIINFYTNTLFNISSKFNMVFSKFLTCHSLILMCCFLNNNVTYTLNNVYYNKQNKYSNKHYVCLISLITVSYCQISKTSASNRTCHCCKAY